jgi:hypothetical protein
MVLIIQVAKLEEKKHKEDNPVVDVNPNRGNGNRRKSQQSSMSWLNSSELIKLQPRGQRMPCMHSPWRCMLQIMMAVQEQNHVNEQKQRSRQGKEQALLPQRRSRPQTAHISESDEGSDEVEAVDSSTRPPPPSTSHETIRAAAVGLGGL